MPGNSLLESEAKIWPNPKPFVSQSRNDGEVIRFRLGNTGNSDNNKME